MSLIKYDHNKQLITLTMITLATDNIKHDHIKRVITLPMITLSSL
jgi:hypothetical protein